MSTKTEFEDSLGAARSFLHAIKMAAESLSDNRENCAFQILAEAADKEIINAQNLVDTLPEKL
ncbi:hypothetical protein [Rhizobium sp. BR 362]|uniref:hypothetical protein n=1 Tax=Rhizobium sp. BR 362 TaxID=3040670 RepID=UPI002F411509